MDMLECSRKYQEKCKILCSEEKYVALEGVFFDKNNLKKYALI